ncbi:MAG: 3-isopropylmalate dehydratase small subunit [Anaerolineales bacterium]|nr:3-isopropylmalate dehydratase small subunit [Anaerolineales bacterium]
MEPIRTITSNLIPLLINDVDTDQIIPARYLKVTDKDGLAEGLFSNWRYLPEGGPNPEFALNRPEYRGASILLAGDNFGCGSSREHAPWALRAGGIRAIISTSFADIFRSNALKNGVLPVVVDETIHRNLVDLVEEAPSATVTIDLENQKVLLPGGVQADFTVDAFSKTCLVRGMDELDYLAGFLPQIRDFEIRHDPACGGMGKARPS